MSNPYNFNISGFILRLDTGYFCVFLCWSTKAFENSEFYFHRGISRLQWSFFSNFLFLCNLKPLTTLRRAHWIPAVRYFFHPIRSLYDSFLYPFHVWSLCVCACLSVECVTFRTVQMPRIQLINTVLRVKFMLSAVSHFSFLSIQEL